MTDSEADDLFDQIVKRLGHRVWITSGPIGKPLTPAQADRLAERLRASAAEARGHGTPAPAVAAGVSEAATLRDLYAMAALTGELACQHHDGTEWPRKHFFLLAERSFELADAMLAAGSLGDEPTAVIPADQLHRVAVVTGDEEE